MAVGVAEQDCQERVCAPGVDRGSGPGTEGYDAWEYPGMEVSARSRSCEVMGMTYQMFWIMPISSRVPKRSLSQVKNNRLQIATLVDGMTSRLV